MRPPRRILAAAALALISVVLATGCAADPQAGTDRAGAATKADPTPASSSAAPTTSAAATTSARPAARATHRAAASRRPVAKPARASQRRTPAPTTRSAASSSPAPTSSEPPTTAPSTSEASTTPPPSTHPARRTTAPATTHPAAPTHHQTHSAPPTTPKAAPTHKSTPPPTKAPRQQLIPDRMASTSDSQQLVTVTNDGGGSTAVLRGYERRDGQWEQVVMATDAHIGTNGFNSHAHEGSVSTPVGLFTLTQAFGNDSDPGSQLPWHPVRTGDVWVDETDSPNYNTLQTGDADHHKGSGENLWTVGVYAYAIVIDYNRWPAVPGKGSAFFLHVSDGSSTAGCVSMPTDTILQLLRWLDPGKHPRIAMGPLSDVLAL
jgi:L,D-peptidoglycan transpeptidase YkuD (ErfK/YbiS/YcfS/YnhG family)